MVNDKLIEISPHLDAEILRLEAILKNEHYRKCDLQIQNGRTVHLELTKDSGETVKPFNIGGKWFVYKEV